MSDHEEKLTGTDGRTRVNSKVPIRLKSGDQQWSLSEKSGTKNVYYFSKSQGVEVPPLLVAIRDVHGISIPFVHGISIPIVCRPKTAYLI